MKEETARRKKKLLSGQHRLGCCKRWLLEAGIDKYWKLDPSTNIWGMVEEVGTDIYR
jgi:hypothetical protein